MFLYIPNPIPHHFPSSATCPPIPHLFSSSSTYFLPYLTFFLPQPLCFLPYLIFFLLQPFNLPYHNSSLPQPLSPLILHLFFLPHPLISSHTSPFFFLSHFVSSHTSSFFFCSHLTSRTTTLHFRSHFPPSFYIFFLFHSQPQGKHGGCGRGTGLPVSDALRWQPANLLPVTKFIARALFTKCLGQVDLAAAP